MRRTLTSSAASSSTSSSQPVYVGDPRDPVDLSALLSNSGRQLGPIGEASTLVAPHPSSTIPCVPQPCQMVYSTRPAQGNAGADDFAAEAARRIASLAPHQAAPAPPGNFSVPYGPAQPANAAQSFSPSNPFSIGQHHIPNGMMDQLRQRWLPRATPGERLARPTGVQPHRLYKPLEAQSRRQSR